MYMGKTQMLAHHHVDRIPMRSKIVKESPASAVNLGSVLQPVLLTSIYTTFLDLVTF
jgi:hypothetical protein